MLSHRHASDSIAVVRATGELDVNSAHGLRERLADAIRDGHGDLVIDLTGVTFIDSTGLSLLLNAQRRLTRACRRLALAVGSGPVLRALQVTRLDWTFDVFDDVAAARAGLASRVRG